MQLFEENTQEYVYSDISDTSSPSESVVLPDMDASDRPRRKKETQKRRRLSPDETRILCRIFERNQKPNSALRMQLAQQLGMTSRNIQIWFQNRRAKLKRDGTTDDGHMIQEPQISFINGKDSGVPILPAGFKLPPAYNMPVLRTNSISKQQTPSVDFDLSTMTLKTAPMQQKRQDEGPLTPTLPIFMPTDPEIWETMSPWAISGVLKSDSDLSLDTIPPLQRKKSFDEIADEDVEIEMMEQSKRRKSESNVSQNYTTNIDFDVFQQGLSESALFKLE